jgi:hypothetical protein
VLLQAERPEKYKEKAAESSGAKAQFKLQTLCQGRSLLAAAKP